jgi:hypothetical protein
MKNALPGQEFFFHDGTSVKSIQELLEHIKKISPLDFAYHCNDHNNDFYNWIRNCIDSHIAEDIKQVKTQRQMVEKLTGHHWIFEHKKLHKY